MKERTIPLSDAYYMQVFVTQGWPRISPMYQYPISHIVTFRGYKFIFNIASIYIFLNLFTYLMHHLILLIHNVKLMERSSTSAIFTNITK